MSGSTGMHRLTHEGGYLPFVLDISDEMQRDAPVTVLLRLDNRDNPDVPPGKPLAGMDFCYFSGLYRNVWMHVTDPLHITQHRRSPKSRRAAGSSSDMKTFHPRLRGRAGVGGCRE